MFAMRWPWLLAIVSVALLLPRIAFCGVTIFTENFETGLPGDTVVADHVVEANGLLPGNPGALAQYSDAAAAPNGASAQSLLMQDSALVIDSGAPIVQWDLAGGDALDTTKTIRVTYWRRVASQTVVGQPDFSEDSLSFERARDVLLTASKSDGTRPEGNGGYLAQSWNWTEGPFTPAGTYESQTSFDAGFETGVFGVGLEFDTWYRIDNYITLADAKGGSPAFLGDRDPSTGEYLGYDNSPLYPQPLNPDQTFYVRTLSADLATTIGQTPYGAKRSPNQTHVAGGNDGQGFVVRALQIFGEHNDYLTQFYDDISVEYVNTDDITAVMEAISAGSTSGEHDYDANGVVDEDDRDVFIQNALLTAYGDTNYDFMVDMTDIQTLAENFSTATAGWGNGDFNGDGLVNDADKDLMEANWKHAFIGMAVDAPDFETAWDQVFSAALPGDFNQDGVVDAADYAFWRNALDSSDPLGGNGDETEGSAGVVDAADYALWRAHYGASPTPAGTTPAPEPASIWTLACGLLLTTVSRRSVAVSALRPARL